MAKHFQDIFNIDGRMMKRGWIALGFAISLMVSLTACIPIARPTLAPLVITATPEPKLVTLTPAPTDVLGATLQPTEAIAVLPTLEPATPTPPASRVPTLTPSFTLTFTESPIPRAVLTRRALTPVAALGNLATLNPAQCSIAPEGGFAAIYAQNPLVTSQLGCPLSAAIDIQSASLPFDNGMMVWASQLADQPGKVIYALYNNGTYQRFADDWIEGKDAETVNAIPPQGRTAPGRGFGKIWQNNPTLKAGLGWSTGTENATTGQIQRFQNGEMIYVANLNRTFIFVAGANTWIASSSAF